MTPTVACVLRGGGEYKPDHVRALHDLVAAWWPTSKRLRFACLTDQRLPGVDFEVRPLHYRWKGWWAKMELFSAAQDDLGDILYLDLDTLIVGSLAPFAQRRELTMLSDFYHPHLLQSGLMYLPREVRPAAYAAWLEGPKAVQKTYRGDGEFLHSLWRDASLRWQETAPGLVCSYKLDVRAKAIPGDARILCFHGHPRPWETSLSAAAANLARLVAPPA